MFKKLSMDRREFIKGSVVGLAALPSFKLSSFKAKNQDKVAKVTLVKTHDRGAGVKEAVGLFDYPAVSGKSVLIKPNFNTADATPGSTHNVTLGELVRFLHDQGAKIITIGERSGPASTDEVLKQKGIPELAKELDFEIVNFSELSDEDWIVQSPEGSHWAAGFPVARPVLEAEYVISTCCLKTHQYGGIFTMSLKNSVGVVPRDKFMRELHGARDTHMRRMIAEINTAYSPQLIVLDGIEAFVDGGPMEGTRKTADVILAGADRIAVDAVGLAILKQLGANEAIMKPKVFEQEQIERAVELGLGVSGPEMIEIVTPDRESQNYADKIRTILAQG